MIRDWLILRDTEGNILARFDEWVMFEVRKQRNGPAKSTLTINGTDSETLLFGTDYIIEFWREDKEANIAAYREAEVFHRDTEYMYNKSGQLRFVSGGVGFEDLLRRRIIYNNSDTARADKSDAAETVMKEYVEEQAGPSATTADGRIADGVMAGLIVDADGAAGDTWTGRKAMSNLLQTLKAIADSKDMAFWIEGLDLSVPSFIFRAKANPYGQDRTSTGVGADGRNSSGNTPVIFSDQFGTAQTPSYKIIRSGEYNLMIVLGNGALSEVSSDFVTDSPWSRIEQTVQAGSETASAALDDKGEAALRSKTPQTVVDLKVLQTPSLLYGRDYFLGDEVTARVSGLEVNQRIEGVSITVEGKEGEFSEIVTIELEQI